MDQLVRQAWIERLLGSDEPAARWIALTSLSGAPEDTPEAHEARADVLAGQRGEGALVEDGGQRVLAHEAVKRREMRGEITHIGGESARVHRAQRAACHVELLREHCERDAGGLGEGRRR